MEFTSFCTLFGSSVAFPIIHPSIGVFVIRLRRNQFQILRSLLFTFQAENWTTSGGVEELCEKGQTSTHTHHTTPPPSQRNFSGGKLSGSNRLRERERHWRWKEVKVIGGTLREMFVVHLQIEFMAKGLKWMCFKDLQGAAMAAGAASALAGPGAAAPKAKRYRIAHIQHPHRSQFGSIVF